MGEQQIFAKQSAVLGGNGRRHRHAGEDLQLLKQWLVEGKRHQSRAGRQHLQAELLGDFIAKRRGAEPRHRQTAGGDHQLFGHQRFAVHL